MGERNPGGLFMKRLFAVVGAFAVVLGLMTSVSAQAGPMTIRVRELDGVKLASGGRLWVHVYHARGGIPGPPGGGGGGGGGSCTDTNTQTPHPTVPPPQAHHLASRHP